MRDRPSANGANGKRDSSGRFLAGNPGGPGNPHGRQVNQLRAAILEAVTEADVAAVVAKLIDAALRGEPWAVRELLDRTVGRAPAAPDLEAIEPDPERMRILIQVSDRAGAELGNVGELK